MDRDGLLFRSDEVEITQTLAKFGGVTYPINGIGSVHVAKPQRTFWIVLGIVAGLVGANASVGVGFIIAAILMFIFACFRPYRLMLRTASGDQQAYEALRKSHLFEIKEAIERAVVLRG